MSPGDRLAAVWCALWALSTSCILALRAEPWRTPLFEDEIYWVGSAYYFDLACRGDWRNPDWGLLPARENPPLAKYAIGLSLAATGQRITSPDALASFYMMFAGVPGAWGQGDDLGRRAAVVERMNPQLRQQFKTGAQVSLRPQLLVPVRVSMVLWTAVTSLLVFLIASKACGNLAALLASQALLFHPIAEDAFNHATSDAVALCFSTAAALAIAALLRELLAPIPRAPRVAQNAAIAGVLVGLACAAKMNSLVVLALAAAGHLYVAIGAGASRNFRTVRYTLTSGLGMGAAALAIFIAINPAIYRNVPDGLAATVLEHRRTEVIQRGFLSGRLDSLPAKAAGVGEILISAPWWSAALIAVAIATMASTDRNKRLVAAWWLIAYLCVTLWIPFQRLRYVAPLLVPTYILYGCAASSLLAWIGRRFEIIRARPKAYPALSRPGA